MKNPIIIGSVVIIFLCIAIIAYNLERQTAQDKTELSEPATAASVTARTASIPTPPVTSMPAGHPPVLRAQTEQHRSVPAIDPHTNFTHFRVGPRNVKSMLTDGDIIWVGTSAGVIRYDTDVDKYELFDVKSGLLANGIFHLSKLDGRLVAGTYGGGLAIQKTNSKGWDIYNVPEGLADAFVYDVLELNNGDIWIATWSGANRVRDGLLDDYSKWDIFTVDNTNGGLPNIWVYALAQGENDTVWLATEGGLAHYNNGQWRNWRHKDGLGAPYELVSHHIQYKNDPAKSSVHHARQKIEFGLEDIDAAYNPNYIVALLVDRRGYVWCGTWGGGLARFDGQNWINYTVNDGLPGNHVFMLHEGPEGQIWAGTSNGLARFDGETFKVYTTHDGLFANNVFSMTTAGDNTLWIGSYGGVAHINSLPE